MRDPSSNIQRGPAIAVTIDGTTVSGFAGETLATVILASGLLPFNRTGSGQPRAAYCNMGTCFECQVRLAVTSDAPHRWVRACMVPAAQGMSVVTNASRQTPGEIPNED